MPVRPLKRGCGPWNKGFLVGQKTPRDPKQAVALPDIPKRSVSRSISSGIDITPETPLYPEGVGASERSRYRDLA
jgi:hypothetical protein